MDIFNKKDYHVAPDLRDPFTLPYNNGEILCLILGGLKNRPDLVLDRIDLNERWCIRPSSSAIVLYDFMETNITDELLTALFESLIKMEKSIVKIALVVTFSKDKRMIKRYIKKNAIELNFLMKCFTEMEASKEWLVN